MKLLFKIFIILITFSACSTRLKFDHYSYSLDLIHEPEGLTQTQEVGDLYLFKGGSFFLHTGYLNFSSNKIDYPAYSYGTYTWIDDTVLILSSLPSKIELLSVTEKEAKDNVLTIYVTDKYGYIVSNKQLKVDINHAYSFGHSIPYVEQLGTGKNVKAIGIEFSQLYNTHFYYEVKNTHSRQFEMKFNVDYEALEEHPRHLLLDKYSLIKHTNKLTGQQNLRYFSPLKYFFIGRRKRNINKELNSRKNKKMGYLYINKDIIRYLSGQLVKGTHW